MTEVAKKVRKDFLKEDPPVYKQDWVVLSLLRPKDKVVEKNIFYVNNFFVDDVNKTINAQATQMVKKLNSELYKKLRDELDKLKNSVNEDDKRVYDILFEKYKNILVNEDEYIDECRRLYTIDQTELMDRYKMFLVANRVALDNEFEAVFGDEPNVWGVKVRGSYGSYKDAELRAKDMRQYEEGFDVFAAPVGKWLPVDFESDEIGNQEYMEDQLNHLMGRYHENLQQKNDYFNKRKNEMVNNADATRTDMTKNRLRQKLNEKRNNKLRQEIAELKGEDKLEKN